VFLDPVRRWAHPQHGGQSIRIVYGYGHRVVLMQVESQAQAAVPSNRGVSTDVQLVELAIPGCQVVLEQVELQGFGVVERCLVRDGLSGGWFWAEKQARFPRSWSSRRPVTCLEDRACRRIIPDPACP
jgi:hypothetical protein